MYWCFLLWNYCHPQENILIVEQLLRYWTSICKAPSSNICQNTILRHLVLFLTPFREIRVWYLHQATAAFVKLFQFHQVL